MLTDIHWRSTFLLYTQQVTLCVKSFWDLSQINWDFFHAFLRVMSFLVAIFFRAESPVMIFTMFDWLFWCRLAWSCFSVVSTAPRHAAPPPPAPRTAPSERNISRRRSNIFVCSVIRSDKENTRHSALLSLYRCRVEAMIYTTDYRCWWCNTR